VVIFEISIAQHIHRCGTLAFARHVEVIRGGIFGSDGAATAHHLVFAGSFPIRCTVGRRSFVNSVP
jgi:hypothetical protein